MSNYFNDRNPFYQYRVYEDTMYDLNNNEKGFEIGRQNMGINQKTLFDYIFKTEIEPYRN